MGKKRESGLFAGVFTALVIAGSATLGCSSSDSSGGGGSAGTAGSSGSAGTAGSAGSSGSAGTAGSAGSSGSAGTAGSSGSAGTAGSSGSAGTAGSAGSSGSAGTGSCPLGAPYCTSDFPLNNQDTTEYGKPWANVTTAFYPCFGPYALCYYAKCTPDPASPETQSLCPCDSYFGLNFVEPSSILNKEVYEQTQTVCTGDPNPCNTPNVAPVCAAMNNQTFYEGVPGVVAISDFSFKGFSASAAIGTDCTDPGGVYSGCMTTACYPNENADETEAYTCVCPNWDGPFQVGTENVECTPSPETWSAAYDPNATSPTIPTPPPGATCFPDAGANSGNDKACPLLPEDTADYPPLPAGTDCTAICNSYDTCLNGDEVQVGYTCDATLCTSELAPAILLACNGLQNCDITAIFQLEAMAGCSCCASQLCDCATTNPASSKTEDAVGALVAAQRDAGETPQCDLNGTLCGNAPVPPATP